MHVEAGSMIERVFGPVALALSAGVIASTGLLWIVVLASRMGLFN